MEGKIHTSPNQRPTWIIKWELWVVVEERGEVYLIFFHPMFLVKDEFKGTYKIGMEKADLGQLWHYVLQCMVHLNLHHHGEHVNNAHTNTDTHTHTFFFNTNLSSTY